MGRILVDNFMAFEQSPNTLNWAFELSISYPTPWQQCQSTWRSGGEIVDVQPALGTHWVTLFCNQGEGAWEAWNECKGKGLIRAEAWIDSKTEICFLSLQESIWNGRHRKKSKGERECQYSRLADTLTTYPPPPPPPVFVLSFLELLHLLIGKVTSTP